MDQKKDHVYESHSLQIIVVGSAVIIMIGFIFWLCLEMVLSKNQFIQEFPHHTKQSFVTDVLSGYAVVMLLAIWWYRWWRDQKKSRNP
jgi:hypothetical protein